MKRKDKTMTIIEAIKQVLNMADTGLTSRQIYDLIIENHLYEFPAANPPAVVNGMIRRHCSGLDFPSANLMKYFKIVGYKGKKPLYALLESSLPVNEAKKETEEKELLPEELIQAAYKKHTENIREALKDAILQHNPAFFEQLIVDLLIAMDYGYDKASGIVVGGSHDGGIDGIIYQDKLGLDKIYLQAKRNKQENTVGRKELQAFVGAMESVQKGVFITTSSFTKEAKAYAQNQQQKSLILIDGDKLSTLMVQYEVGIQKTSRPIYLYRVDEAYFE